MKRYDPEIEWPSQHGVVHATVRLRESETGSVVKWEDAMAELRRHAWRKEHEELKDQLAHQTHNQGLEQAGWLRQNKALAAEREDLFAEVAKWKLETGSASAVDAGLRLASVEAERDALRADCERLTRALSRVDEPEDSDKQTAKSMSRADELFASGWRVLYPYLSPPILYDWAVRELRDYAKDGEKQLLEAQAERDALVGMSESFTQAKAVNGFTKVLVNGQNLEIVALRAERDKLIAECERLQKDLQKDPGRRMYDLERDDHQRTADDLRRERVAHQRAAVERDILREERDRLNLRVGVAESKVENLRAVLRGERDAAKKMSEEFKKAKAELDVLRDAMRTVAEFYRARMPIGVLPIGRCLSALTPEQRAACGWPDPEPPKAMTWDQALDAMRAGKSVAWYHWHGTSVSLCHDGVIRFDGPVDQRRPFEFRLEYAEKAHWRVVEPACAEVVP